MTPGGIPVRCKLGQYDDDWTIVFTLYSAYGTFSIESGTTAKIRGTKRDGLGYSANATINISAGTVTVAGDKQITAVAGDNLFELVLLKGTKELSTANIIFSVEPAAMDAGTLVSDSQVQEILDMSADVIAASANVSTLRGNFAPAYSSSSTYSVGDYAMYNNQLYRCTTAISTAEAWTAGHWTAVALGDDVSDLKSDLKNFGEMVTGAYTVDSSVPTVRAAILNTGAWYVPTGGDQTLSSIVEIPVGAKEIYIHANDEQNTYCGILKTYPQSFSGNADFSTEYPSRIQINAGEERTLEVPSDGKYLYYIRTVVTGENVTPQEIRISTDVLTTNGFIPRGNIVPNYIGRYDGKYYYASSAGVYISSNSSSSYGTLKIPVEPSMHYTCNKLRYLTQTGADDKTLAASEQNITSFTTASNAKHIYATYYTADNTVDNLVISSGDSLDTDTGKYEIPWLYDTDKTSIDNLKTRTLAVEKPFMRYTGDDQSYMFANANSIKRDKIVSFTCDFLTFGTLEVGLANNSGNNEVALVIDSTTVKVKKSGTEETGTNHGLTLSDKISVVLIQRVDSKINYEISSNGEKYSGEITRNNGITKPYFTVSDMTVSNVDFSTTCRDIQNSIWMFGDSYFSYGTNRWMYYLIENGYSENCLIDAYAGESSAYALPSLKSYIGLAKPKIIVWCVGMNDGGDGSSAPSSTWMNAINEVLSICNQFEITPILATIPTVPSINHEKKNEWVRNSDYQYIDFAKAVGAQSNGTWFTGMLSSDNVHPTISGAMALYYQAITDCPQLLLKH